MIHRGLILLDSGNSTLKWQLLSADHAAGDLSPELLQDMVRSEVAVMPNDRVSVKRLLRAWRRQAAQAGLPADTHWRLSWLSVGPPAVAQAIADAWRQWCGDAAPLPWHSQPSLRLVTSRGVVHYINRYRDARQLGADRWLAGLGLLVAGPPAPYGVHMVVSAGTATTVDLIRFSAGTPTRAEFLGGWILPGLGLMAKGLRAATRDLDRLMGTMSHPGLSSACADIPRNSADAIASGIVLAQAGFVDQLVQRHAVKMIWLHGGGAEAWRSAMNSLHPVGAMPARVVGQPKLVVAGLAGRLLAVSRP